MLSITEVQKIVELNNKLVYLNMNESKSLFFVCQLTSILLFILQRDYIQTYS